MTISAIHLLIIPQRFIPRICLLHEWLVGSRGGPESHEAAHMCNVSCRCVLLSGRSTFTTLLIPSPCNYPWNGANDPLQIWGASSAVGGSSSRSQFLQVIAADFSIVMPSNPQPQAPLGDATPTAFSSQSDSLSPNSDGNTDGDTVTPVYPSQGLNPIPTTRTASRNPRTKAQRWAMLSTLLTPRSKRLINRECQ